MKLVVNGEERDVERGVTVEDLVREMRGDDDPSGSGVAAAVNGEVVRRATWSDRELVEGDSVEIVAAVQGGAR